MDPQIWQGNKSGVGALMGPDPIFLEAGPILGPPVFDAGPILGLGESVESVGPLDQVWSLSSFEVRGQVLRKT